MKGNLAADYKLTLFLIDLNKIWKPLGQDEWVKGKQQLIMKYTEVQLKIKWKTNYQKKI